MPIRRDVKVTALAQGKRLQEIHSALEPLGIEVVYADCLKQVVEGPSNVVVCDGDADLAGPWTQTIRHILEARPEARVVLLSRLADEGMWVDVLSAGAYDLLPGPCPVDQLRAAVLGALGLHNYCLAA